MNYFRHMLLVSASVAMLHAAALPPSVGSEIAKKYGSDARYFDASIDLNGDGKAELIVHLVGPSVCGTGGCSTLVYSPSGSGYRLVSEIGPSRTPIRASAAKSNGWRNLIVHIAGGGQSAADVELLFDGKSYPGNPTVKGSRIKTASAGGNLLIRDFTSLDQAQPLAAQGGAGAANEASFDCSKATAAAEKAVCADAALGKLDRQLNDAYRKAMADWPADEKGRQQTAQRQWLTARNACASKKDSAICLSESYKKRLVEIQIRGGQLLVPTPVAYDCSNNQNLPFTAVFFDTDPRAAVLTWGDNQVVAFVAPAASGARYQASGVDFWEHQKEATVEWKGTKLACKVL